MSQAPAAERTAVLAGVGCYLIWGFVPLAFQAMGHLGIKPPEILAHRTLWGAPTALLFVLLAGQGRQVLSALRSPSVLGPLLLSSLLIGTNWIVFMGAVSSGRVLETSLGYYITPLLNMAAGAVIFRERFDRAGVAAIALAAVGVALQAMALGRLPWVSLALALSFGAYGILRKRVAADAQTGLFIECLLMAIPSLGFVIWQAGHGQSHFGTTPPATLWLIAAGPITAIPLVLFSWVARRISMSSLGFLQFIGPTIGFGIGLAEGEALTPLRILSFAFIWGGAVVYAYGAWRRARA